MTRWIVFDSATAEKAEQHPHRSIDTREHAFIPEAIAEAVQSQRPVVVVVPADGDEVTVARITPPDTQGA